MMGARGYEPPLVNRYTPTFVASAHTLALWSLSFTMRKASRKQNTVKSEAGVAYSDGAYQKMHAICLHIINYHNIDVYTTNYIINDSLFVLRTGQN